MEESADPEEEDDEENTGNGEGVKSRNNIRYYILYRGNNDP